MNILTIDSATTRLTLALYANGQRYSRCEEVGTTHSDVIINYIQDLLHLASINIKQLDLVAYNAGPGSFTGLRIGVSVALGITYGLGIKVAAVDSFFIVGYSVLDLCKASNTSLSIALDARLSQVYFAQLNLTNFSYITQPELLKPDQIKYSIDTLYTGDGFNKYKGLFDSSCEAKYISVPEDNNYALLNYVLKYYPNISCEAKSAQINYVRNEVAQSQVQIKQAPC